MIDYKELRCGNWILVEIPPAPLMLHQVKAQDIADIAADRFAKGLAIEPVKLSQELLIQCGFTKRGDNFWLDYGADLNFTLKNGVLTPDNFYTAQPFTREAYPRYLHELQNIIYWLTKKELTLNLNP